MCCHEIQAVKAFHLKFKARLSWITAVLKMFAVEFNCVGIVSSKSFSLKFLRNHFLVSTFLKMTPFWYFAVILSFLRLDISDMYLRKYKISKAAFLENTSQQLPLYIIWFRTLPNRKYYFMSESYLKPSQTFKIKLLVKVVNASRDTFRTVFSIQNVFRTSRMALFTKIMNGWKQLFLRKAPS